MNRGLVAKSLREMMPITLGFGVLAMVILGVVTFAVGKFQKQFSDQLLQLPFMQSFVKAMIGAPGAGDSPLNAQMFAAIPWSHPVVLALVWGHAITCCTRLPAGEVDRGTIDVLLSMPVSRVRLYVCDGAVWLFWAVVLMAMVYAGNLIGNAWLEPAVRQSPARVAVVAASMMALYLSVGGLACLCSAVANRRGSAMVWCFIVVLAWFLINYLALIWEPARNLAFVSVLHYHRPLEILGTGAWAMKDAAVLLGVSAVLWAAGAVVFARRDLVTV